MQMEMIENQQNGGAAAGLQFLEKVDGLYVEQQWEVLETVTCGCYEGSNRYRVMDSSGKVLLFTVKENTTCCNRYCCGEHRPYTMNVYDESGKKPVRMMVFKRGFAFCGWAVCPCCIHETSAHYTIDNEGKEIHHTGIDTLVGHAKVPWAGGCFTPTLNLSNRDGQFLGQILGPTCCVCDCCGADFGITDAQGNKVGELKKLSVKTLKGVVMETTTDADNFQITFPVEMDPTTKMLILAALFQIDFSFFEDDRSFRECRLW